MANNGGGITEIKDEDPVLKWRGIQPLQGNNIDELEENEIVWEHTSAVCYTGKDVLRACHRFQHAGEHSNSKAFALLQWATVWAAKLIELKRMSHCKLIRAYKSGSSEEEGDQGSNNQADNDDDPWKWLENKDFTAVGDKLFATAKKEAEKAKERKARKKSSYNPADSDACNNAVDVAPDTYALNEQNPFLAPIDEGTCGCIASSLSSEQSTWARGVISDYEATQSRVAIQYEIIGKREKIELNDEPNNDGNNQNNDIQRADLAFVPKQSAGVRVHCKVIGDKDMDPHSIVGINDGVDAGVRSNRSRIAKEKQSGRQSTRTVHWTDTLTSVPMNHINSLCVRHVDNNNCELHKFLRIKQMKKAFQNQNKDTNDRASLFDPKVKKELGDKWQCILPTFMFEPYNCISRETKRVSDFHYPEQSEPDCYFGGYSVHFDNDASKLRDNATGQQYTSYAQAKACLLENNAQPEAFERELVEWNCCSSVHWRNKRQESCKK